MAYLKQEDLMDDIRTYLYTYADAYCRDAAYECTKMAKFAIEQFYKDYSPDVYDRTDDLKKHSYSSYYHDNGKVIYGGVRINSDNMQPYPYKGAENETDPFEVAEFAWHGWHGHPIRGIYSTPPLDMVRGKMEDKSFLNKIDKNAERVAKSQSYKCISAIM